MSRKLSVTRPKKFAGCLIPFTVYVNSLPVGKVKNGKTLVCDLPSDKDLIIQVSANTSTGTAQGSICTVPAGESNLDFSLFIDYSFWVGIRDLKLIPNN